MEKIKKVFIVKNNTKVPEINENAQKSFNSTSEEEAWQPYYLKGKNKQYLQENSQIEEEGILLLFSYYDENEVIIEEMYIGECIVNKEWDIQYRMYRHLEKDNDDNAIRSIIDKIDLDLKSDFDKKVYLNISKMQSLYDELNERICSTKKLWNLPPTNRRRRGRRYTVSVHGHRRMHRCAGYTKRKKQKAVARRNLKQNFRETEKE